MTLQTIIFMRKPVMSVLKSKYSLKQTQFLISSKSSKYLWIKKNGFVGGWKFHMQKTYFEPIIWPSPKIRFLIKDQTIFKIL